MTSKKRSSSRKKLSLENLFVFPWHPLFLTLYAILFFLANNISQVEINAANRLLLIFSGVTVALVLILRIFFHNFQKAGLLAFIMLGLFFGYGQFLYFLRHAIPIIARHRYIFPVVVVVFIAGIVVIIKAPSKRAVTWTKYLNLLTLMLLLFPISTITIHEYKIADYQRTFQKQSSLEAAVQNPTGKLPDVYFIVLDGYGRSDALQIDFGVDNKDFLTSLRQKGFYIADCSMSNYSQTELSFTSTLNMEYLDVILTQLPPGELTPEYFAPYIQHNQVRTYLESLGYSTVAFYTGYSWAQWNDATYFLGDPIRNSSGVRIVPFEATFLKTTMLLFFSDTLLVTENKQLSWMTNSINYSSSTAVIFTLDQLPFSAQLPGPKFVFAHVMLPHPPYLFGPDGEMVDRSTQINSLLPSDPLRWELIRQGYGDQVLYADMRMQPILDSILTQSNGNAVILLEGDHGAPGSPDQNRRMENLLAYYFPDQDYTSLYPSITPVNSFRVVLNQFFGQDYPLLQDYSFFSNISSDRIFTLIFNTCGSK